MMKLYDFLPCPFGQKVRIVLAEKSLTYELIQIDLAQADQRRPEFLRLNPFARVPVLVDEDTTVYDSTIIVEYLEDEYPEPPVLPTIGSSAQRARARLFEDFADTSFTPQVGQLMAEMARAEADRDQGRLQRLHRSIERALDYLNHELTGSNFSPVTFRSRTSVRATRTGAERVGPRSEHQPPQRRRVDKADAGTPEHSIPEGVDLWSPWPESDR